MTFLVTGIALMAIVVGVNSLTTYNYHTDLKNIDYQLSRIADALNKRGECK